MSSRSGNGGDGRTEEPAPPRIGVFVCHCGGNISDVVDVARVAAAARRLEGVAAAETQPFLCSDPGQLGITDRIRADGLDRVVVAACSPSLHQATFRRTVERAGVNPFLFEHVNLREQVSWVVRDPEAATQKAIRLVSAAVARAAHLIPLQKRHIPVRRSALVIGGGAAGLTAARDLAGRGMNVTLVEEQPWLGGHLARAGLVGTGGHDARILLQRLIDEVRAEPLVRVLTNARVASSQGVVGDFRTCVRIGDDGAVEELEVPSGVIVLATGSNPYQPHDGEFGFGRSPRVITLPQLHRLLDPSGPTAGQLRVDGSEVRRVAFIYCVGARQLPGNGNGHDPAREGCSRTCCTEALAAALELKRRKPEAAVYALYQDIRAYGRGHEECYEHAADAGVVFVRYDPKHPPQVGADFEGHAPLAVRVADRLTRGLELELPVDVVVLVTATVAHPIPELMDTYRCALGRDGFLMEVHPKLKPVELAVPGVLLGGSCQAPMDLEEACTSAAAAASKAAALMARGEIEMDPFVAHVDAALCTGCRTCLGVCPYGALSRDDERRVAAVSEALCAGCGTCAATCPSNAIQQSGFNDAQVEAEVRMLLASARSAPPAAHAGGRHA